MSGGVHHLRQRLPFLLRGLDSDNGSEFSNQHLLAYCQKHRITFTRSRPYKKNDSAHIEQKNWSVRRLVGYERYTSKAAFEQLDRFYRLIRLYINFFQPVLKLQAKTRHGARVHKVYDQAQTPYRRLLERTELSAAQRETLAEQYERLDPVRLLAQINHTLERLWELADRPDRKSASVTTPVQATTPFGNSFY